MFRKTRFIHHLGRLYFKPLPSSTINECYQFATSNYPDCKPEQLAQIAVQFLDKSDILDHKCLTSLGKEFMREVMDAMHQAMRAETSKLQRATAKQTTNTHFDDVAMTVHTKINMMTMMYEEEFRNISPEENMRFMAFELGVLEYNSILYQLVKNPVDEIDRFVILLNEYAIHRYPGSEMDRVETWIHMLQSGELIECRRQGVNSESNARDTSGKLKPGYIPVEYLQKAMGWD